MIYFFSKHDAIFFVLVINKMSHSKWWIHVFTYYCVKMLCRVLFLAPKPTWWLTLTDGVRLPQPGVSVAGQVLSDHAAFGQNGDEDGEADGDGDNGHQELPVFRDLCFRCPSACKRERKKKKSQKYYNNIMSYAPDVNVRPPCFISILEHWFVGVVWIEFLCLLFHNGSMNSLTKHCCVLLVILYRSELCLPSPWTLVCLIIHPSGSLLVCANFCDFSREIFFFFSVSSEEAQFLPRGTTGFSLKSWTRGLYNHTHRSKNPG